MPQKVKRNRKLNYNQNLHVLISDEQHTALKQEADRLGLGLSAYLRLIISQRQFNQQYRI